MPELKLLPTQEMIDNLEKENKELKDAIIRYCAEYIEEINPDNEQDCIDYFLSEYKKDQEVKCLQDIL